ncbi:MAG: hypothetical protein ACREXS_01300 [Gammaproteobacteria bacterium]
MNMLSEAHIWWPGYGSRIAGYAPAGKLATIGGLDCLVALIAIGMLKSRHPF